MKLKLLKGAMSNELIAQGEDKQGKIGVVSVFTGTRGAVYGTLNEREKRRMAVVVLAFAHSEQWAGGKGSAQQLLEEWAEGVLGLNNASQN